jgi:hypothetical protein
MADVLIEMMLASEALSDENPDIADFAHRNIAVLPGVKVGVWGFLPDMQGPCPLHPLYSTQLKIAI